jgi:hypothetical protein
MGLTLLDLRARMDKNTKGVNEKYEKIEIQEQGSINNVH